MAVLLFFTLFCRTTGVLEALKLAPFYSDPITLKKFYEKKKRSGNACIAMKALAHKLARACYHIMKNKEAYNPDKLFA